MCTIIADDDDGRGGEIAARASEAMHSRARYQHLLARPRSPRRSRRPVYFPGSPPRINAKPAIFPDWRSPMYRTMGWPVRASADQIEAAFLVGTWPVARMIA